VWHKRQLTFNQPRLSPQGAQPTQTRIKVAVTDFLHRSLAAVYQAAKIRSVQCGSAIHSCCQPALHSITSCVLPSVGDLQHAVVVCDDHAPLQPAQLACATAGAVFDMSRSGATKRVR
jgi:hypothetical protein